jgi:hypothetical protein
MAPHISLSAEQPVGTIQLTQHFVDGLINVHVLLLRERFFISAIKIPCSVVHALIMRALRLGF